MTALAALIALNVVLAGCKAELTTTVVLARDGSGVVSASLLLDRAAADSLRDQRLLSTFVGSKDLQADGWQVTGPIPKPPGGFVEYRAEKAVRSTAEAQAALARVSTAFEQVKVERSTGLGTVRLRVAGPVDLTAGPEALAGDPVLTEQLGEPLGITITEAEQQLGSPLGNLLTVRFITEFPEARTEQVLRFGEVSTINAVNTQRDLRSFGAAAIGLLGLVLLAGVGAAALVAKRRRARQSSERRSVSVTPDP
jgi:hypothetical protein